MTNSIDSNLRKQQFKKAVTIEHIGAVKFFKAGKMHIN